MRTPLFFCCCWLFFLGSIQAQDKPAYRLYSSTGKEISYDKMLKTFGKADVVLLGELHNNPICHWMQWEITHDLFEQEPSLVLGAEMFEADDQLVLDEYLAGTIRERDVEKEAKVWPNYDTDYAPLLRFAKTKQLPFIATNIPRRYASLVARQGLEIIPALSDEARTYIAPQPMPFDTAAPGYAEMLRMDFGHGGGMTATNMVKAQAIKDATMAHFIVANRTKGKLFIHYQGDYHSANGGGIAWYLQQYDRKRKVAVLSSVEASSLDWNPSWEGRGDFILIIPESMGKTY